VGVGVPIAAKNARCRRWVDSATCSKLADTPDRLLDVKSQPGWLRAPGFDDVDCYWKWLEMALLIAVKPAEVG
jgi:hypothetical protein